MNRDDLNKIIKMLDSPLDSDAVMGLRGLAGLFEAEGATLGAALRYAADNLAAYRTEESVAVAAPVRGAVNVSGMPDCRVAGAGRIELVLPGQGAGEEIALSGAAAEDAAGVAAGLKDALVLAALNKSRLKLKLVDVKDKRGEVAETVLEAVYDREGMIPVRVWTGVRGEVAALATVLRKAVAAGLPDLMA